MKHRLQTIDLKQMLRDGLMTTATLIGAAILCFLLRKIDQGDIYVSMIFLLAVAIVARFTHGLTCGIIASILGVLGVNYAFTAPYFEFCLSIPGYLLSFASMLLVSMSVTALVNQIKSQEKQRYLAQVEKMRANLLRAVSHDLRTPLTSISGAANVLIEHPEMPRSAQIKLMADIADDSQWLIRMVENLLSITRIGNTPADLHKSPEAAEEVMAESVRKFRKRFSEPKVEIRVPDALIWVPMDPILIEQVLTNLLENAAYHARATKVQLRLRAQNAWAIFEVADDGAGVAPERLANLFDGVAPPSGVSDASRGMGIGLSVCKAIIAAHGGKIEVENRSEGGACFRFWLPMEEKQHEFHDDHPDR